MLGKLSEEDFAVLRGPFESGRQSPQSLAAMLLVSTFAQVLMFVLTYIVAADTTRFPNKEIIYQIHLIITSILIILSIIYALPPCFKSISGQRIQYFVVMLVSQNLFGIFLFISALFIIGEGNLITNESIVMFTYTTLLLGGLIFLFTCIRFYILLKRGEYRKGSKKDINRFVIEDNIKSFIPLIIFGSVGAFFIIRFIIENYYYMDSESIGIILIGIALFFSMLFVLPEQLVILYCKYRFKKFQF